METHSHQDRILKLQIMLWKLCENTFIHSELKIQRMLARFTLKIQSRTFIERMLAYIFKYSENSLNVITRKLPDFLST